MPKLSLYEPRSKADAQHGYSSVKGLSDNRTSGQCLRVLVVDDDRTLRTLLEAGLEHRGNVVRGASGAQEAIELLARESFDAIISDIDMPGENGLNLAARIHSTHPNMPVLLLTGVEDVQTAVRAMRNGVSDYLLKPCDLEQVSFSLTRAVHTCRMRQELEGYRHRLEAMVEERTQALSRAVEELQVTSVATLEALGTALDYRDHETLGHSRRVTDMSRQIAQILGVSDDELTAITYGAYLHDIGKLAVPDAVLQKPGALTPEEQQVMRSHVTIGHQMVTAIPFLRPAAEIVLTHHEAYDGSGYPQQLKGNAIPLGARIFAIADTVDAMTSDRPYRRAKPFSAARQEIIRCSGTQFDPQIASAFLSVPENAWSTNSPPGPRR